MKKAITKFITKFVVVLMTLFYMPHPCSSVYAGNLTVIQVPNDDDQKEDYPHRSPSNPTDESAYAIYNRVDSCLTVIFEASDPAVCISIYKNDTIIKSYLMSVNVGDTYNCSLANYGAGSYRIVITMIEEEEPLVGTFVVE